jgi:hypothetical protein
MTETPDTSDISFTKRDVDGLINALAKMAGQLTRGQWGLLLSIFAAAASNVELDEDKTKGTFPGVKIDGGMVTVPRNKTVVDLRKQLRAAHMPARKPGAPLQTMIVPPIPSPPPKKSGG